MERIREFIDERIRALHGDKCVHCGGGMHGGRTRDHVPSKALLSKPYPPNLPTVDACPECNGGYSGDEEYLAALLGCVLAGSSDPSQVTDPNARRVLERNPSLCERLSRARVQSTDNVDSVAWAAEWHRIANVVVKNARGHLLFECGELFAVEPARWVLVPLVDLTVDERSVFERGFSDPVLPELGSRLFVRYLASPDLIHGWITVQEGRYRFAVDLRGEAFAVRIVIAEYLAAEVIWLSSADCA